MKKLTNLQKRIYRVRSKVKGTNERPRLSVVKSNKHIYVQVIDDVAGVTILSVSDREAKRKKGETKVEVATNVGSLLAKKMKKAGIEEAVFDRRGRKYHGRIQALADAARVGGIKF